ncbi:hypothetical protein ACET3X_000792 [Alternaria dauci]|uniref:Uncharacterized protein n=1 Tax=Alternaria dauci TaxID=48095 RepID=A0ABR3UWG8_9PLEO
MKAWTTTRSAKRNTAAKSSHTKLELAVSLLTPTTRPTFGFHCCLPQHGCAPMMRNAQRCRSSDIIVALSRWQGLRGLRQDPKGKHSNETSHHPASSSAVER